jgi:hypothetical protein
MDWLEMLDLAEQLWIITMQVLAMVCALGALALAFAGELWVARNMVRGWGDRAGWRGMVAVAADLDAERPRKPGTA